MVNLLRYIWKKITPAKKKITRAPPVAPVTNIRYVMVRMFSFLFKAPLMMMMMVQAHKCRYHLRNTLVTLDIMVVSQF